MNTGTDLNIDNPWISHRAPQDEDADCNGEITIELPYALDPLSMAYQESTQQIKVQEHRGRTLKNRWRHTDQWVADRERFPRGIKQIAPKEGGLYALADDGTLWSLYLPGDPTIRASWEQLPGLPDGVRLRSSEP